MSIPTTTAIRTHLAGHGVKTRDLTNWAAFLAGLDWAIIKPLVQMAVHSHTHPALAAGLVAHRTHDEQVRTTLVAHLETKGDSNTKDTPTQ